MQSQALKLVFSNKTYIVLSISIFVGLLLLLSIASEYVFLQPIPTLYVQDEDTLGFLLIVLVSVLSGIVVSMSIFRIKILHAKQLNVSFAGPILGASAGICSCGPTGFAIVSTFGTIGGTATAFLTNYEIPLRLISIGILAITYFSTSKEIISQCKTQ